MSFRLVETAIALFIAVGFAVIGDTVFRRRASCVYEWLESFLAGAGICATILFPLSVAVNGFALYSIAAAVGAAAAFGIFHLVRSMRWTVVSDRVKSAAAHLRDDRVSAFMLLVIAGCVGVFAIVNLRSTLLWDGFQIWSTKAMVLHDSGALGRDPLLDTNFLSRMVGYPALIPLYEALVALLRQRFVFEDFKPIFLLFYLAMLVSTWEATRRLASGRTPLVAAMLVATLPGVAMQANIGGYADMPLAAVLITATAAWLRSPGTGISVRSPLPWLIATLPAMKHEGTILAAILSASLVVAWWPAFGYSITAILRRMWQLWIVILSAIALRIAYLRWIDYPDPEFAPIDRAHLVQAVARIPEIVQACGMRLLDVASWGLFWPAALAAAGLLAFRGRGSEQAIGVATISGVLAYSGIFLFTNWQPVEHIDSAYVRLLSHFAPLASVAMVTGYWHLVHMLNERATSLLSIAGEGER